MTNPKQWRAEDMQRLHDLGYHLYPTNDSKMPAGKWRKGGTDYVTTKPSDEQVAKWARRRPLPPGWAVLCGGPMRTNVLDIEAAGIEDNGPQGAKIREVAARFPDSCKRRSPSGGLHVWFVVTDAPAPTGRGCKLVNKRTGKDETGKDTYTLLCEFRGHGQYAVMLGHGRGDLQADFAPFPITLADLEALYDELREVSDLATTEKVRAKLAADREAEPKTAGATAYRRSLDSISTDDIPGILARAIVAGVIGWADVLEDGWNEIGATPDGWSLWLRPAYGTEVVKSATSANGAELLGTPALTMHSSSVPWAEPEESYSPIDVLARCWFGGSIPKAIATVKGMVKRKSRPAPFDAWPARLWNALGALDAAPQLVVNLDAEARRKVAGELSGDGVLYDVFRRGGGLVRIHGVTKDGGFVAPASDVNIMQPLNDRSLAALIDDRYDVVVIKTDKDGNEEYIPTLFPREVALRLNAGAIDTMARGLVEVIHAPIITASGEIMDVPGYTDGVLFAPTVDVPDIPEEPTQEEAVLAMKRVSGLVDEFPFVTDGCRANYLGTLITPFLMRLSPPPWRMSIISAHEKGTGKSLLAEVLVIVHGGSVRAKPPADEDEIRKQITTILTQTTGTVVVWDNLSGLLDSAVIAALLTAAHLDDRRLGATEDLRGVNNRLWCGTGNNVKVSDELMRRSVWIHIDADCDNPAARSGFAIENLKQHVTDRRGEIIADILTALRAWILAGSPTPKVARSDTYGQHDAIVNGILTFAGATGAYGPSDTDPDAVDDGGWGAFLHQVCLWRPSGSTFSARDLHDALAGGGSLGWAGSGMHGALPDELADFYSTGSIYGGRPMTAQRLGKYLGNREGRPFSGLRIDQIPLASRRETQLYRVREVGKR